ncbi:MAG: GNAT family N-acetyltransferase [Rivularia sp. (in: cyanobacteria)]
MEIFTLDTSCVLNLLNTKELVDQDLILLMRFGFDDIVNLVVTEQLSAEVIKSADNQRQEIIQRIGILPVHNVSKERCEERDLLAKNLFQTFWANAKPGSRNAEHGYRDCLHLASHKLCGGNIFVTCDNNLHTEVSNYGSIFGIIALSPTEAIARIQNDSPLLSGVEVPSPVVRKSRPDDKDALKNLLEPLKNHYSDFDGWLNKTLNDKKACINLASIGNQPISGIAIWKKKDNRTAKLSLFYVAPESRKLGLGQHLLFYCIRELVGYRFEKVILTTSEENADLLMFFTRYGFRIEGISHRRYQRGDGSSSAELVLTKHLFYQRITENDVDNFVDKLVSTVFSLPKNNNVRNEDSWFIPPHHLEINHQFDKVNKKLVLIDNNNKEVNSFSIFDLEKIFYPVRFATANRKAYLIPIQPQWANQMIQVNSNKVEATSRVADKLFLRTDNVYYCHPWCIDENVVGAPILFYISSPDSIIGGMGYILERRIAFPEELFLTFGGIGVYKIPNIQNHTKKSGSNLGCAMALKFGWWVPFPNPIPKSNFSKFGIKGVPQHMQSISYQQYEDIMKEGGLEW